MIVFLINCVLLGVLIWELAPLMFLLKKFLPGTVLPSTLMLWSTIRCFALHEKHVFHWPFRFQIHSLLSATMMTTTAPQDSWLLQLWEMFLELRTCLKYYLTERLLLKQCIMDWYKIKICFYIWRDSYNSHLNRWQQQ